MPPIMGAGAFILAELLGISYAQVMYAAIIPSVVYYLSLYLAVDFYAAKNAVEYRSEMSGTEIRQQVLLYCHTIIPLVLFVGSVMVGYSVFRSAIVCIIATPPIAALRKETRMSVKSMLIGIASGMKNTVSLGAATACAGIIVGVIAMTGFGHMFWIRLRISPLPLFW